MEPMVKTLAQLGFALKAGGETRICGIALDSRLVQPGHLFAALPGAQLHGGQFIARALEQGATAILTDHEGAQIAAEALAQHQPVVILARNPAQAFAGAAALWFGGQPETMVAVTGTNGKTSVATFARQIWAIMGEKAINVGTTGVEGAWSAPLAHTTPDALTLQRVLADAAQNGVRFGAMEASSHGIDQYRLDGVRLKAAGFTNFTQDHLDYHGSFEAYFAAKAALFDRILPPDGVAVFNINDPKGRILAEQAEARGGPVMTVGYDGGCDLVIGRQRFDDLGQDVRFLWQGTPYQVHLDLIGGFQAENVALAAALVLAAGAGPERVFAALPQLTGVRGRMQPVGRRKNGAAVFVDFAHTPDAIATALQALRPHVMGRLIIAFGAGGDRDKTKRPLMGAAACEHADAVFVTDDNPRSEEPAAIRAEIMAACPTAHEVGDRAEAILRAVDALQPGDALLIAGKGHETGQIVKGDIFPFDDAEQASIAIAALDGAV